MSRGNPIRRSSNTDGSPGRPRGGGSPRGSVGATSLSGLSGGGKEPKGTECWYIDEKLAQGSPARDMAGLAIAAAELREYLATDYGFFLSMDDAMDCVESERNGFGEDDT